MPQIRPALSSDIAELANIEIESFLHDRLSRRAFATALASPAQSVLVATDDDASPVGYALLHFRAKAKHARLYSIAVSTARRGQGTGKELLAAAEAEAIERGKNVIRLEVRRDDEITAAFYRRHGFVPIRILPEYYSGGADAIQMEKSLRAGASPVINAGAQIAIVTGRNHDLKPFEALAESGIVRLMTAADYLARPELSDGVKQIINLCPVEEYLSQGYYVSLLARARGQRAIPNIDTVSGLIWKKIYRKYLGELTELIKDKVPAGVKADKQGHLAIEVHFGQVKQEWAKRMAARAYRIFPAPILEVMLSQENGNWQAEYIWPLSIAAIDEPDMGRFVSGVTDFVNNRRNPVYRRRKASFDLAILYDPDEKLPPSTPEAIAEFIKAADRANMNAEVISRKDIGKLSRFDALFIRETTNIENHTFTFAREAEAAGMPVIDDSVSILRCSNKVYLREAMARAKIATPATVMVTRSNIRELALSLDFPIVLKIPDGSFSRGVIKVDDAEQFIEKARNLLEDSFIILAQEFLPTSYDWRIGVLGGKPIFAAKYFMARDHWQIYNHAAGQDGEFGAAEYLLIEDTPQQIVKAAVRASLQMGRGLYGVDLKEIGGKPVVIEVNDNPNIDAGYEDSRQGDFVYDAVISYFREQILISKGLPATPPRTRLQDKRRGLATAPYTYT